MKYLFLIIRHMFPRKRWTETSTFNLLIDGKICGRVSILKDQFGNIKKDVFQV